MASNKLPFIFNNIVALMCSLLFLNGLVNAPKDGSVGFASLASWESDGLPRIPAARASLSLRFLEIEHRLFAEKNEESRKILPGG